MILETVTTDVRNDDENFDFVVKLMNDGSTAAEKLRLSSAGNLTITGTLTVGGIIDMNNNKITNVATPVADTDAANKAYVDATAEGLHVLSACKVATTTNIPNQIKLPPIS